MALRVEGAGGPEDALEAGRRERARVSLLDVTLDRIDEAEAIACIIHSLEQGRGGWVMPANLDLLRQFHTRPDLRELADVADLVVADGMPLVWASRIKGTPLPVRIAGSELVWSLSAEAALAGKSIYMLGDRAEAREMAERKMRAHYPGVRICGSYSPPNDFNHDPGEVARIRERLAEANPDIVYVALGFPKQERLIAELRDAFPSTWFVCVGASLSFIAGYVKRAPEWMARSGLEWVHRLGQEPRRLAKRYLVHGLPFAAKLLAHAARARLTPSGSEPARVTTLPPPRRVVFHRGSLERERADELVRLVADLPSNGSDGGRLPVA